MSQQHDAKGIVAGLTAYILWGVLPIYWKLLSAFKPEIILTFRIVYACILLFAIALVTKKFQGMLALLKDRKKLLLLCASAVLITINWFVYIWSVNHAFIVEASLGYFINPLVSVAFGVIFLKEKVTRVLIVSVAFALVGVGIMTAGYGRVPWIALVLAFSFAAYGLVKKVTGFGGQTGLTLETGVLALPAALFLGISVMTSGITLRTPSTLTIILSLLAGLITAIPLILFGHAAQKLSLSMLGFIQYVSPTIQLAIGVLLYGEAFTTRHVAAFAFIWAGILIYSVPQYLEQRKRRIGKVSAPAA